MRGRRRGNEMRMTPPAAPSRDRCGKRLAPGGPGGWPNPVARLGLIWRPHISDPVRNGSLDTGLEICEFSSFLFFYHVA